ILRFVSLLAIRGLWLLGRQHAGRSQKIRPTSLRQGKLSRVRADRWVQISTTTITKEVLVTRTTTHSKRACGAPDPNSTFPSPTLSVSLLTRHRAFPILSIRSIFAGLVHCPHLI